MGPGDLRPVQGEGLLGLMEVLRTSGLGAMEVFRLEGALEGLSIALILWANISVAVVSEALSSSPLMCTTNSTTLFDSA